MKRNSTGLNTPLKKIDIFVDDTSENTHTNASKTQKISVFEEIETKNFKIKNEKPLLCDNIKKDIEERAEDPSINEYKLNPVHDFGTSLLKGMGWTEGKPIGKTNKGLPQPIEYIKRPDRLGLGAESQLSFLEKVTEISKKNKNYTRPISEADGKVRHFKGIHEKPKVEHGPKVIIIKGKYLGRSGKILSIDAQNKTAKIHIDKSEEVVIFNNSDYKIVEKDKTVSNEKSEVKTWIFPRLKVRIIDQKLANGKYFNTKAVVKSVFGNCCDLVTDSNEKISNISENSLETIVPKEPGSEVIIVSGKYKGTRATLMSRDSKNYLATVFFSKEAHIIPYDCICQIVSS